MATWGIQSGTLNAGAIQLGNNGDAFTTFVTSSTDGINLRGLYTVTASYAQIGTLDVDTINSITKTVSTLEIQDKLLVAGSGSTTDSDLTGGGLQIGGTSGSDVVASMLYDDTLNGNTGGFDFNLDGSTFVSMHDVGIVPTDDNEMDLGASGTEFKDLYIDGVAYIDTLNADALGANLDCGNYNMTNVDIDSGAIDGTVIGASSVAAGSFAAVVGTTATFSSTLSSSGDTYLGNATSDKITATGRFHSDLVPSSDSARDLGTSALQWAEVHADTGYIDALTATGTSTLTTVDINGGNIDGTVIGASSVAAGSFAAVVGTTATFSSTLTANGNTQLGNAASDVATCTAQLTASQGISCADTHIFNVAGIYLDSINADDGSSFSMGTNWTSAGKTVADLGTVTTVDINGGTVDGVTIGGASASAGTFTDLTSTGTTTLGNAASDVTTCTGRLTASQGISCGDTHIFNVAGIYLDSINADNGTSFSMGTNWTNAGNTVADLGTVTAATSITATDLIGTNVDGIVGADTARAGTFTTLTATTSVLGTLGGNVDHSNYNSTNVDIDSGAIDGTTIGASSAAAGTFTAVAGTTGTFSGVLKSDDTTEATSTTDGSLQTDGGLSVAMSAVIGDDLNLLSNSAVFKVGSDQPFTLTHSNASNTLMATANHRLAFGDAGDYIAGDGTDITIVGSNEINLDATTVDLNGALDCSSTIAAGGHITLANNMDLLAAGAACDIGTSSQSFANVYATNVYTGDMHLKNERGDWTIFEEADHLRIRNNLTGQTFKLGMTPIEE